MGIIIWTHNLHHLTLYQQIPGTRKLTFFTASGATNFHASLNKEQIKASDSLILRGVEWVHGLFLFPLVLGKNVVATCKITSEKCNCFLIWKSYFKMALIWKKGYFWPTFHIFSHQGKIQKFLQHISQSHTYIHTYTNFTHPTDFFCLTNFEKKIRIYQVRFLFGMSPGVDSYSRHFGTINK